MKKYKSILFVIALLLMINITVYAYTGGEYKTKLNVTVNKIKFLVNGKKTTTSDSNVNTILYNGTTYVPLRNIAESLKLKVDYDIKTSTVNITK